MAKQKLRKKCTVRDGKFVEPCSALESVIMYGNPRGKQRGIYMWTYHSFKSVTSGPTRSFVGVKSGEHVEKGMIFNFCPFCAESIDAPVQRANP